ncbi:hypothetical protein [Pseudoalteromonas sp. BDTF-M6]|uniref:hypothetical protein n=1 Tax=Pseudoalteromonas sp. BDTF-M6 TaxID=2796132 RepID=UPI001BAEEF3E|nr:hypothetical protein [Pseudoalteromonas sp. BDTF-M6]MBS3796512.1 hypothetical protein [Pseudoalteromonas sp. BDTF-M6]
MDTQAKLRSYYFTAVISLVFAVIGFTYNAWRLEVSEDNNIVRTASFEVLKELWELERIIYAAHYDEDEVEGNPRKGWIQVGLITDLSVLISGDIERQTQQLKRLWAAHWQDLGRDDKKADELIETLHGVRQDIKQVLIELD